MNPELTLPAPPLEYSMAPSEYQPYSEYTIRISRDGFENLDISGAEIYGVYRCPEGCDESLYTGKFL